MLVLRVRMVHIPQAVVVEAQEAQGLLEAELLAEMVAIQISRVRRRAVLMVVVAERVVTKATQATPQNMAEVEVVLGHTSTATLIMAEALFMEQVGAEAHTLGQVGGAAVRLPGRVFLPPNWKPP